MNGHLLLPSSEEMVRFALEIAKSKPDIPWEDVAEWVRQNTVSLKGKRDPLELIREKFDESDEMFARFMERRIEIYSFLRGSSSHDH